MAAQRSHITIILLSLDSFAGIGVIFSPQ